MYRDRKSVRYLEDEGLEILSKKGQGEESRNPPKLRKALRNIDYLAESGLEFLIPEKSQSSSSSSSYNESIECTYLEQCFTILDRIGNGSFGHVLKVFSRQENKFYAVKLAKQPFLGAKDRTLRLSEVYNHWLISEHPNIVTLDNAWEEDRLLYMLMELCKTSLANHKMPEEQCWEVLADITSALDAMHTRGLGHFDVKLDNIMEGYDGLYKLGDFGLTFDINNPSVKYPLEGDSKYLAPELLLSDVQNFSDKADIFSLGISVLELAGNLILPPHGEVWSAMRKNIFPRTQTQHLSDDLFLLLTQMMAREPAARPSTKQLLCVPRIKSLLEQRLILKEYRIAYPTDPLQHLVLVIALLYALVFGAIKQLLKHDFSYEFDNDLSTTQNTTNNFVFGVPGITEKDNIYTSTPQICTSPIRRQQSVVDPNSTNCNNEATSFDLAQPSTSTNIARNNSYYIPPAVMACNISPIKMSREIKLAIRERNSRKRKYPSVARRLLFTEGEEEYVRIITNQRLEELRRQNPQRGVRRRRPYNVYCELDHE